MLKTTVFTLGVNMTTSYSCFHSFPVTDFHHHSFFTICFGFRLTLLDLCKRWLNPRSFFYLNGSTKIFSQLNNLYLVFQYSKGTGSLSSVSLGKKKKHEIRRTGTRLRKTGTILHPETTWTGRHSWAGRQFRG